MELARVSKDEANWAAVISTPEASLLALVTVAKMHDKRGAQMKMTVGCTGEQAAGKAGVDAG